MFDTKKKLKEIVNYVIRNIVIDNTVYNQFFTFETASNIVCRMVYDTIKDVTGSIEYQVTIYRKYEKSNKECNLLSPNKESCCKKQTYYIKMIAYKNEDDRIPSSYHQEHCPNYFDSGKQHFYVTLMEQNSTQVEVLTGKNEIEEKFLKHRSSIERENRIEGYIGIPINCD